MVFVLFLTCSTFAVHADTHSAEINNPDIGGGKILLYTTDGEYKGAANVLGLYQPDTIASYNVGGMDYIVTANEGDDREYDGWEDYDKAASLKKKKNAQFSTQLEKDIDELNADNVQFEMVGEKAYFWEGVDARSQKKGCEPEALALAKIGAKTFAYIGLEKQGGFFIYDITNPKSPDMIDYYNDINYDALPTEAGDLAPEGMVTFTKEKTTTWLLPMS